MTKGITGTEPDPRTVYADIIDLPHHQSPTRPHMSMYDRAAQFSAYKALTGYEDMVAEEARLTDARVNLEDADLERLNAELGLIAEKISSGAHPTVAFTVFEADEKKAGGHYIEISDEIRKIDTVEKKIVLMSKLPSGAYRTIRIEDITEIVEVEDC